jgi:hypothetical protein
VPGPQPEARRDPCLARRAWRQRTAPPLQLRLTGRGEDSPAHATAGSQRRVSGVYDGVDVHPHEVAEHRLDTDGSHLYGHVVKAAQPRAEHQVMNMLWSRMAEQWWRLRMRRLESRAAQQLLANLSLS